MLTFPEKVQFALGLLPAIIVSAHASIFCQLLSYFVQFENLLCLSCHAMLAVKPSIAVCCKTWWPAMTLGS